MEGSQEHPHLHISSEIFFFLVVYADTYSELAPFASSASEEEEWEDSGTNGGDVFEVRQLGNWDVEES